MDTNSTSYLKATQVLKNAADTKEAKESAKGAKRPKTSKDPDSGTLSSATHLSYHLLIYFEFSVIVIDSPEDANHLLAGFRRSLAEVQVDLAVLDRRLERENRLRSHYLGQIADLEAHIAAALGHGKGKGKTKD